MYSYRRKRLPLRKARQFDSRITAVEEKEMSLTGITTRFRYYWNILGGHCHMRVFANSSAGDTFGNCGEITMTVKEFNDFRQCLISGISDGTVEFIAEGQRIYEDE